MTCRPPTLLSLLLLAGCSRSAPTTVPGLITDQGTFPSPSGDYQLVIGSKSPSLVDYRIVNLATGETFAPEVDFSDVMRWAAYWEDDSTLWVHSSDLGLSVWKRGPEGRFTQEWLAEDSDLVPTIPAETWNFLPSSSQREWQQFRQPDNRQDGNVMPPVHNDSQPVRLVPKSHEQSRRSDDGIGLQPLISATHSLQAFQSSHIVFLIRGQRMGVITSPPDSDSV